jgi:hypothetical protein
MRRAWFVFLAVACALPLARAQQSAAPAAPAQSAPAKEIPTPEQLEPGVETTPSAPSEAATAGPAADARAATPRPPPREPPAAGDGAAAKPAKPEPASHKGPDRLQLDATDITGNRELPKVLYIVPWKRSDLGDLMGKPVNSLLDEVLEPLDRDVFQRENRYYNGLKPAAVSPKGGAAQAPGPKP